MKSSEYHDRYMNLRQAVVDENLSTDGWKEIIRFAEEEHGVTILYDDEDSNPSAMVVPWKRYTELLGIERMFDLVNAAQGLLLPEVRSEDLQVHTEVHSHMGDWTVIITHKPTGLELSASSDVHKSALAAKTYLLSILPWRILEKQKAL